MYVYPSRGSAIKWDCENRVQGYVDCFQSRESDVDRSLIIHNFTGRPKIRFIHALCKGLILHNSLDGTISP